MRKTSDAASISPEVLQAMNRRDFLKRAGCAAALALTASGLGLALYDQAGPPAVAPESGKILAGLGDYSLPSLAGKTGKMAIIRGVDRGRMVERGIQALGGMDTFIQKGERVLIKVNAAFATPASLAATTHPETLAALVRLCFNAGAAQVLVTDNPINNPESCFEISGLAEATRAQGGRLVTPKAELFAPVRPAGAVLLKNWPALVGAFKDVNKVLIVSPVKDHHRAGASMTLKNLYGFLGGRRNVFHQDINAIMVELALLLKPTLCVLDGVTSMLSNGPTGGSFSDLKETNTMIVSTDPVAADAAGLELLDRPLHSVPYLRMAHEAGAGQIDYATLNPERSDTGA